MQVGELAKDPATRGKLLVDVMNEPDNFSLRWEPQPNGTPGLMALHLRAMDAIEAAVPGVIFLIEVSIFKSVSEINNCAKINNCVKERAWEAQRPAAWRCTCARWTLLRLRFPKWSSSSVWALQKLHTGRLAAH